MEIQIQTPNTQKSTTLSNTSLSDIVEALKICYLGDNRFRYSDDQLMYWANEIQNDFNERCRRERFNDYKKKWFLVFACKYLFSKKW
jgi:hypothetical protein